MALFFLKDGDKFLKLGKLVPSFIPCSFFASAAWLPENHIVLMSICRIDDLLGIRSVLIISE